MPIFETSAVSASRSFTKNHRLRRPEPRARRSGTPTVPIIGCCRSSAGANHRLLPIIGWCRSSALNLNPLPRARASGHDTACTDLNTRKRAAQQSRFAQTPVNNSAQIPSPNPRGTALHKLFTSPEPPHPQPSIYNLVQYMSYKMMR